MNELELVGRASQGDEAALASLLEMADPHLRQRLSGGIEPAFQAALQIDDILQITYLEVFLRLQQFEPRGPGSFRGWVLKIAENNLRDAVKALTRKRRPPRHRQLTGSGDGYTELFEMVVGTETSPSQACERTELREWLDSAMDRLPVDYAKVIRLYDLERLDGADVAARMNRSVGAVYMLRCRAHDRLAELLSESPHSEPGH